MHTGVLSHPKLTATDPPPLTMHSSEEESSEESEEKRPRSVGQKTSVTLTVSAPSEAGPPPKKRRIQRAGSVPSARTERAKRRKIHICTEKCHHVCATEGCNEILTPGAARSRCVWWAEVQPSFSILLFPSLSLVLICLSESVLIKFTFQCLYISQLYSLQSLSKAESDQTI